MLLAEGHVCPTRRCRFIDYEDLPLYSANKVSSMDMIVCGGEKLEVELPVYTAVA
jgi:hypothetical protein